MSSHWAVPLWLSLPQLQKQWNHHASKGTHSIQWWPPHQKHLPAELNPSTPSCLLLSQTDPAQGARGSALPLLPDGGSSSKLQVNCNTWSPDRIQGNMFKLIFKSFYDLQIIPRIFFSNHIITCIRAFWASWVSYSKTRLSFLLMEQW